MKPAYPLVRIIYIMLIPAPMVSMSIVSSMWGNPWISLCGLTHMLTMSNMVYSMDGDAYETCQNSLQRHRCLVDRARS